MKKLFVIVFAAITLASCGSNNTSETSASDSTFNSTKGSGNGDATMGQPIDSARIGGDTTKDSTKK